jgi:2-hydroxy-3-keto-5-methylthiopentenyl-1-phosphate phosphatase
VFVRFDGVVTCGFAEEVVLHRFGEDEAAARLIREQQEGPGLRERVRKSVESMGRFSIREANTLIDETAVDGTFLPFVEFCRKHGYPLHLVSDGWDYAIERILRREKVAGIPVFANMLMLGDESPDGKVTAGIRFPFDDAECDRCACCKRNILLAASGDNDIICYVGGSPGDECPARYADIVFARGGLQTYCQSENITHFLYETFRDVQDRLQSMTNRKVLHARRRARMERRAAYLQEA